jgi:phosphatidylinositol glycan class K
MLRWLVTVMRPPELLKMALVVCGWVLMVADDMACNSRNPEPGAIYNSAHHKINVYGDDVEVDYRGYEVNVENFVRVLTGRVPSSTPRSKRLLTDERSNVFLYMTGHGGDGFIKFQDAEEISNVELADVFEQMWQMRRYNELFFVVDTCQAASLYANVYSPNVVALTSSLVGEDSLSHHIDANIGVYVIDRFTYYALDFLENVRPTSKHTLTDFFAMCPHSLCVSTTNSRTDLLQREPSRVPLTDFLGSTRHFEFVSGSPLDARVGYPHGGFVSLRASSRDESEEAAQPKLEFAESHSSDHFAYVSQTPFTR